MKNSVISQRETAVHRFAMKKILLLSFALVSAGHGGVAHPIDSLKQLTTTAQGDQKVKALNELFRAYQDKDPVLAIGYAREALALATDINDVRGKAAAYNNLGVSYRTQGALDKALEYYLRSMQLYKELGNKEGIATTQNNIANIYSIKRDYGQALKYYEESHLLFLELNDPTRIIGSLNNLGTLNMNLQLYEQAYKYFTEAFQRSEKIGKPSLDPISNIGNLYYQQGNSQRAVEFYEKALALAQREDNRISILTLLNNLGEVYTQAGQTDKAIPNLRQGLELSHELQAFIHEPALLKNLATNYARQGKYREAYETSVKYDLARERIYGEESSRKIAQMEMALLLAEKETEMEALQRDDEMKTLALQRTRLIIFSVVMGIALLLGGLNLAFGRRKRL